MKLQLLDILIVLAYLVTMVLIGFYMRKTCQAQQGKLPDGWQKNALVYAGA